MCYATHLVLVERTHRLYSQGGMAKRILDTIRQSAAKKWRSFYILPTILAGLAFTLSLISFVHVYTSPYNFSEIEFNIPKGSKTWEILNRLYDQGILPHPIITLSGALFVNGSPKIIAGEYAFKAGATPYEIINMLIKGNAIVHQLTFPEGLTIHEIMTNIAKDTRLTGDIPKAQKEGALFPSTYYIHRNQDRNELIQKMLQTMDAVVAELMRSNTNPYIKTNEDLIIFASMLEREAAHPSELSKIAGVFVNRFKKEMRLQSDPTVIYGITLGKYSLERPLNRQDLKIDSDHNTYTRYGLPKTAICCPGLAALEAASHPEDSNDLYFVLEETGKRHLFSVTYKEHLEHIRRIRNKLRVINE